MVSFAADSSSTLNAHPGNSFMVFASVGHFSLDRNNPQATPHAGTAMIVFACLFILGFAATWGPIIWTICAELYPSRYRSNCMALSTASNWFWNFLLAFFTPFIIGDIDSRYGYIFAACLFSAAVIVYFFVMEGQGRTCMWILLLSSISPAALTSRRGSDLKIKY